MTLSYLSRLCEELHDAERQVHLAVNELFSLGSSVTWVFAERLQYGTVVSTSLDRVRVQNSVTGKTYWIYMYRILDAARCGRVSKEDIKKR